MDSHTKFAALKAKKRMQEKEREAAKAKAVPVESQTISEGDAWKLERRFGFALPPTAVYALGKDETAAVWWPWAADEHLRRGGTLPSIKEEASDSKADGSGTSTKTTKDQGILPMSWLSSISSKSFKYISSKDDKHDEEEKGGGEGERGEEGQAGDGEGVGIGVGEEADGEEEKEGGMGSVFENDDSTPPPSIKFINEGTEESSEVLAARELAARQEQIRLLREEEELNNLDWGPVLGWYVHRYRRDSPLGPWLHKGVTKFGPLSKMQVTISNLTNGFQYCFSIQVVTKKGVGAESNKSNPVMIEADLPSGWFRFFSEAHQKFYYANLKTKQSSWTRPDLDPDFLDESIVFNFSEREIKFLRSLYNEEMYMFKEVTVDRFLDALSEVGERYTKRRLKKLFMGYTKGGSELKTWQEFMTVMDHIKRKAMNPIVDLKGVDPMLQIQRRIAAAMMQTEKMKLGTWKVEYSSIADRDYYISTITKETRWDMPDEVRFFLPPKLEDQILKVFDYGYIESFKQQFSMLDIDGSGDLSAMELKLLLAALEIKINNEVFDKMVATIDTNGNGSIEFDEFCWFMLTLATKEKKGIWKELENLQGNRPGGNVLTTSSIDATKITENIATLQQQEQRRKRLEEEQDIAEANWSASAKAGNRPSTGGSNRPRSGGSQRPLSGGSQRPRSGGSGSQRPRSGGSDRPMTGSSSHTNTGKSGSHKDKDKDKDKDNPSSRPQTSSQSRPSTSYEGGGITHGSRPTSALVSPPDEPPPPHTQTLTESALQSLGDGNGQQVEEWAPDPDPYSLRHHLERFYAIYNKRKVRNVARIIAKYGEDNEDQLLEDIAAKYGQEVLCDDDELYPIEAKRKAEEKRLAEWKPDTDPYSLRHHLERYYAIYNPRKVKYVERIMARYGKDKEDYLLEDIAEKYGQVVLCNDDILYPSEIEQRALDKQKKAEEEEALIQERREKKRARMEEEARRTESVLKKIARFVIRLFFKEKERVAAGAEYDETEEERERRLDEEDDAEFNSSFPAFGNKRRYPHGRHCFCGCRGVGSDY